MSGKGWSRKSSCPQYDHAINLLWFDFVNLLHYVFRVRSVQN